ncbi:MAG TPA: dephospho-CoA kinase [Candidatus Limnocylindrales bacterium]
MTGRGTVDGAMDEPDRGAGRQAPTSATSRPAAWRRSLRIGLTGPIGCGKSTVAAWLAARGAVVVDADRLARAVTERGEPAFDAVVDRFGPTVVAPDGSLDRAALGRLVFSDAAALRDLETIVHPAVRPRIVGAVERAEADGAPVVAIEAIKLVEGGYAEECDEVWLVTCSPDEQRARLVGRGMAPGDAAQRIGAQGDLADRLAPAATRTIDTSGAPDAAEARVRRALEAALLAARR